MSEQQREQVRRIFVEHLGVGAAQVVPDMRVCPPPGERDDHERGTEHLGADSLDVVELAMAIEEEFAIDIPDGTEQQLVRVLDWYELVERKTGTA